MKKALAIIAAPLFILILNYFLLGIPSNSAIDEDTRNKGINTWVHYEFFVNPQSLVIDLRKVDMDKSTADVFRVLFQVAEKFQDKNFTKVILTSKGKKKFYIQGDYFKEIGSEYTYQNPVYLLRTFPENTYMLGGTKAYSTWTGGVLGVMKEQMEDLDDLAYKWFKEDLF